MIKVCTEVFKEHSIHFLAHGQTSMLMLMLLAMRMAMVMIVEMVRHAPDDKAAEMTRANHEQEEGKKKDDKDYRDADDDGAMIIILVVVVVLLMTRPEQPESLKCSLPCCRASSASFGRLTVGRLADCQVGS